MGLFKNSKLIESPIPEKFYAERERDHENMLRERLNSLVPNFLGIRKKMGIGEEVGFGFLREVHDKRIPPLGSLPELKGNQLGDLKYTISGHFTPNIEYANIQEDNFRDILVMPNIASRKKQMVSIYDFYNGDKTDETNLLQAPDDVFMGLIAHELAHEFDEEIGSYKLPPEIIKILKERKNDLASGKISYKNSDEAWEEDEAKIEIIAALFGYKEQIIAKIEFMIKRLEKLQANWAEPSRIGRPAPQDLIKGLEFRKQQVMQYCH